MKHTNKWLLALLPAALLASCAEDKFESYLVPEPESVAESQYLNDYQVLKEYTSGLKLGAVVDVSAYSAKGAIFGLTKTNFNEVTGGASLMHSTLAKDNGGINLSNIVDILSGAEAAQHTVFGSTLVSNTNVNGKYFTNILADKVDPNYVPQKVEIKGHDNATCVRVQASEMVSQPWDNQFWLVWDEADAIKKGDKWEYTMKVRADVEGASVGTQVHKNPSEYIHWAAIGNIEFPTEWTEITASGSFDDDAQVGGFSIAFNLNDFSPANNYYFDNISFKINGKELMKNSNCDGDDASSFVSKDVYTRELTGAADPVPGEIVKGYDYTYWGYAPTETEVEYNKPCIIVRTQDMVANPWDSQFWIRWNESDAIKKGDKWECKMKVRADQEASIGTQVHKNPSEYIHWSAIGNVSFTPEWSEFTASGTFGDDAQVGGFSIAFNLNDFNPANNYYFASISFKINGTELVTNVDLTGSDNSNFVSKEYPASDPVASVISPKAVYTVKKDTPGTPLTPAQRRDTVDYALRTYIKNVMDAASGKITSWDVIGNVLDDNGKFREAADAKTEYNWSADLGEENFARLAVKYARASFAESGGNAGDLKLFVNEDGLDNEAKLAALSGWITKWESDNATKIDGISTSINAAYSENAEALEAAKTKIADMLAALAKTGKLVRISGINLTYKDAAGSDVKTAVMTTSQAKNMGSLYGFIVKKYKELVPSTQQYGIFISNIIDNGDTPNGLWNSKYNRKPQYGGFADGLR
ncbi:MAG: endo-1,4-beta-xylanase [Bacteroidales bacterium]|nr:endo-1,4-beta-xylanase [Bacteroidales bacterium]